jgi:hypothetical protein
MRAERESIFESTTQYLKGVDVEVPEGFRSVFNKHGVRYEDYYISCDGAVGSTQPMLCGNITVRRFHVLAPSKAGPYLNVAMRVNKQSKYEQVHVLVARSWIGPSPEGLPHVNHKDGLKRNNHYLNLEWTTRKGNAEHASALGLLSRGRGKAQRQVD